MRFLLSLLFVTQATLAQQPPEQRPISIRHLTTGDGLSQGSCFYIRKDSRGFVWISSQNALNRFDGSRFTVFRSAETDSSTIGKGEVRGIVESPDGNLWFGTEECLNRYNRRTNSFQRLYPTTRHGKPFISQHESFYADDSTVWYVNAHQGAVRFNYRTGRRMVIDPNVVPKFSINTEWIVHQPDSHRLISLLPTGFRCYDYRTRRAQTFLTGHPNDAVVTGLSAEKSTSPAVLQSVHRCQVAGPHKGNYCFVGPTGIYEFNADLTQLLRRYAFPPGLDTYRFVSMAEDAEGRWWLGVEGIGIWVYDPAQQKIVRQIKPGPVKSTSLLTNQLSAVYIDDLGLVWANGDPFGVDIIYPNSYTIETLPDNPTDVTDLNAHAIRGLCEDRQGHVWIGTIDGGLRRYDPQTGQFRAYTSGQGLASGSNVRQIIRTRSDRLLVATVLGLLRYDAHTDRLIKVPNPLCSGPDCGYLGGLTELPDGRFVLATHGGLFMLDATLKPIAHVDPSGTYFGSVYFDSATQQLYAGRRDQDLVIYHYSKGKLLPMKVVLPGHNVMYFYPDPTRRCLWLCTDRGLVRFDPATQRPIQTFTVRNGLPDDVIYGLLPDKRGRFWLSTNNGLVRFLPAQASFAPVVSTKGREYDSHASLLTTNGTFYFGGVHGLDRFVPEQLDQYKAPVPVRIISFLVNDQPYTKGPFVGETGQVSLSSQERTFSIGLAALDYLSNGKNQLFYQLSGVEKKWVALAEGNTVRYADLSPGQYTFRARAIDARGLPTSITELRIRIDAPFWQQAWFWLLAGFGAIGTTAFWVRGYNRQKLARQQRLLRNSLATQEQERRRIARDLHDDVGNTLAAAKGMLERAKEQTINPLPDMDMAYSLIDKAGADLRTITHDLMPIEFENYSLPDVVRQLTERVSRSSLIRFEFIRFGEVRRLLPERELVLYRIIAELVQNGLKHGGPGQAIVQLGYLPRHLSILVETPVKSPAHEPVATVAAEPGIGKKNIAYRAEYLRATLQTDSNAESYIVMLDVPYDSAPAL